MEEGSEGGSKAAGRAELELTCLLAKLIKWKNT